MEELHDTRMKNRTVKQRDKWETPDYLFNHVNKQLHFDIDLAASVENTKCEKFFGAEDNALKQSWDGIIGWCNPPYSDKIPWIEKAISAKDSTIAMLLPASTDTIWFHKALKECASVLFTKGRVNFEAPDRISSSGNVGGSALFIFDKSEPNNTSIGILDLKEIKAQSKQ